MPIGEMMLGTALDARTATPIFPVTKKTGALSSQRVATTISDLFKFAAIDYAAVH
jgi:hypothetical protein